MILLGIQTYHPRDASSRLVDGGNRGLLLSLPSRVEHQTLAKDFITQTFIFISSVVSHMINQPSQSSAQSVPSQQNTDAMVHAQVIDPETNFLILEEVMGIFRLSRITIYRMVAQGVLPVYRVGRRMRFLKRDVMKYLAKNRYGS